MRVSDRPRPPVDLDDNPEWTEAEFAVAAVGPHWARHRAAEALREAAGALRRQAAQMEAEADAIVAGLKP